MKLLRCNSCGDIVRLSDVIRRCSCGESWGKYVDSLNAEYGGTCVPLGFNNSSFRNAIWNQPESGMGERFEAFVIPKNCPTMEKRD